VVEGFEGFEKRGLMAFRFEVLLAVRSFLEENS